VDFNLHHIGYATQSIETSLNFFKSIGYREEGRLHYDLDLGVKVQFIKSIDKSIRIELVQDIPEGINHPVQNIIRKRPGCYHLAYEVDHIAGVSNLYDLKQISNCAPALAFKNRHISFYLSRDGGIVELISTGNKCDCDNND
jgi:hypothetical protein